MAVYRHRPQTIAALETMVDAYAEERSSEIGEVGSDCRIVGARFIREVRIGNGRRNRRRLDPLKTRRSATARASAWTSRPTT